MHAELAPTLKQVINGQTESTWREVLRDPTAALMMRTLRRRVEQLDDPQAAAPPPSSNVPGPGVCYSLILIRVLLERITVLWSEGHHRSARALHVTIKTLLIGLTMLRYTPVLRWRVCRPPLDLLITGFLMGNALLELFLYPGSKAAMMTWACLDEDIRLDLCSSEKDTKDRAIRLLVEIQLSSLDPNEVPPLQQASLYFWGSSGVTYLGRFLWERQDEVHRTGATIRSEEHETLVAHPQHRDGCLRRYKAARRESVARRLFLVLRTGPFTRIAAWERLEVGGRQPDGNTQHNRRKPRRCRRLELGEVDGRHR